MKPIAAALLLLALTACANHCRIDQTPPADATFEDTERMTREECK
jgi:hypothetical protein